MCVVGGCGGCISLRGLEESVLAEKCVSMCMFVPQRDGRNTVEVQYLIQALAAAPQLQLLTRFCLVSEPKAPWGQANVLMVRNAPTSPGVKLM